MAPIPPGRHTLYGACHCKAVKFVVSNVDLTTATKCNCTLCHAKGRVGIMLGDNDIKLRLADGKEQVINFDNQADVSPPELSSYQAGVREDKGNVNLHFCNKCGVDLFYTENIPSMPDNFVNVNLFALDLSPLSVSYTDVTDPKVVTYVSGQDDSWKRRQGQPFEGGSW